VVAVTFFLAGRRDGVVNLREDVSPGDFRPETVVIKSCLRITSWGTIEPIGRDRQIAAEARVTLHTDAVQACRAISR